MSSTFNSQFDPFIKSPPIWGATGVGWAFIVASEFVPQCGIISGPFGQHPQIPKMYPEISGLLDAAAKEHEKCRADCEELQAHQWIPLIPCV